jgi:opacity protein-like surface antigen
MNPTRLRTLTPLVALVATLISASGLRAQVGHAPEDSPYRDIQRGSFFVATLGTFRGSGGKLGVAPHDGHTYGLRWSILANRPLQIGFGVTYGRLQHLVQNQSLTPDVRTTGPVETEVIWTDVALQINLTGGKTWHGIAPYFGAGLGLALTSEAPDEPTDFRMGNKFYFAPMAGTRIFLASRLHLQVEGRYQFWQITYPESFRIPPFGGNGNDAVLPGGSLKEWSVTPWLQVGLGYALSLPF